MATIRRAAVSSPPTTSGELASAGRVRLAHWHHGQRLRGCGPVERTGPARPAGFPQPGHFALSYKGEGAGGTRGWWGRGQPDGLLKEQLR